MRSASVWITIVTAATLTAQPAPKSGLDVTALDRGVRPQDDLFAYVNAAWLAATAMPDDRVFYGAFQELAAKVERDLHAIILDVAAGGERWRPDGGKIADLYHSMVDEAQIERLGLDPARPQLARIEAIETPAQLAEEAGRLAASGDGGLFDGAIGGDPRSPGGLAVQLSQGGTLLPDRDHYLGSNARDLEIRGAYEAYLSRIFSLAGRADPASDARELLALETELATAQWSVAETRNASRSDARYRLERLQVEMPGFDWAAWARPQGLDRASSIVLGQPSFFQAFAAIVARTPMRTLKAWLTARYLTSIAPYISAAFGDARFEFFGRVLTGQRTPTERWRRGVALVNGFLGDAIGRLYVERHFPASSRQKAAKLAATIVDAHREAIATSSWLSPRGKAEARRKLDRLTIRIGYPDAWRNYRSLAVSPGDLVGNVGRGRRFDGAMRLGRERERVDPRLWLIPPQTVNAYYTPGTNEMVVPAAILQPPFFDPGAEDAVNYGAIGAIIGHEIGHALDDRGRLYDAAGRARDWWAREDAEAYAARAGVLVAQFSRYEPVAGARLDGLRTLRENVNDLGGLSVAYAAYRRSLDGRTPPVIDGLTADQRFFIAYARIWRSKEREAYLRQWVITQPHAPPRFRVNGIVAHVPAFYEAFAVKPGDRLFLDPLARVRIW